MKHVMTALAITLVSTAAWAGDTKIIPATSCQVHAESRALRSDLRYSQFGKIVNRNSQSRILVVCPILRDDTGRALSHVRVFFADGNPARDAQNVGFADLRNDIGCVLNSTQESGDRALQTTRVQTSSSKQAQVGDDSAPIGAFTFDTITKQARFSGYTLFCSIPLDTSSSTAQGAFIGNIVIVEEEETEHD